MKSRLFKALLVIVALFLGLFAFEIILRLFTLMPENLAKLQSSNLFLYENKPNAKFPHIDNSEGYNILASINSDGFRDHDFKVDKDPGVFRIAVLGDSFEEALQVELVDTWQKVLEGKLSNDLKRPVEVYNFGVSGYGTDQEWLTLKEKVWKFKPDLVILAFTTNDIGDVYKNKLVVLENDELHIRNTGERYGGNWLGKFLRQTYTYHLLVKVGSFSDRGKRIIEKVRTKILGFPPADKFFLSDAQLVQGPFEVIASQKNPPQEVLEGWRVVDRLMLDMKKQAEIHSATFMVTFNVSKMQIVPSAWESLRAEYKLNDVDFSPNETGDALARFLAENSITFYLPLEDALTWYQNNGDLHYKQDAHFNKNGHKFMGESTAKFVTDHVVVGSVAQ